MLNPVVVGIDGREGGRDALALARALTVEDQLVCALVYPYEDRPSRMSFADYAVAIRDEAKRALQEEGSAAGLGDDAELIAVGDTSPARGLHRVAETSGAGLIVVGSAHRGPVGRALAGDVSRGTLHGSPCPVAVAPRGYREREGAIRTIGVAYDGGADSEVALDVARALAEEIGAQVRTLVVADPGTVTWPGYAYTIDWENYTRDRREHAEELVKHAVAKTGGDGEVLVGSVAENLESGAAGLDLLVMGSRGWGPVGRTLLGSTADHLVHHSSCPVLVVPRGTAVGERSETGSDATATA